MGTQHLATSKAEATESLDRLIGELNDVCDALVVIENGDVNGMTIEAFARLARTGLFETTCGIRDVLESIKALPEHEAAEPA